MKMEFVRQESNSQLLLRNIPQKFSCHYFLLASSCWPTSSWPISSWPTLCWPTFSTRLDCITTYWHWANYIYHKIYCVILSSTKTKVFFDHITRRNGLEKTKLEGMVTRNRIRCKPWQRWDKDITDVFRTVTAAGRIAGERRPFCNEIWRRGYANLKKLSVCCCSYLGETELALQEHGQTFGRCWQTRVNLRHSTQVSVEKWHSQFGFHKNEKYIQLMELHWTLLNRIKI